jgi:Leucine-rich repeat (LRR) protein
LTVLPNSIGQLTQLKNLDIYDNKLTVLPNSIGQLTQLQILNISNNQLTSLPESIGQLTQLEELYTTRIFLLDKYCKILNNFINSLKNFNSHYKDNKLLPDYNDPKEFYINDLIKLLNKINSNYYLYYYLFSPNNLVKLSKFNYYQIPVSNKTGSLYFSNNSDTLINIIKEEDITENVNGIESKHDKTIDGLINSNNLNYTLLLNEFMKNNFTININIKNEDFLIYKNSELPPSLYNALGEFYEYSLIELVKKIIININTNKTTSTIYNKINDIVYNIAINKELVIYKILCDYKFFCLETLFYLHHYL